jgi:hypothetical protein
MQSDPKAGKYENAVYNNTRKRFPNHYCFQTEATETIPEHQLGFRRILAGIYTHTSGHIVGAPMAHYNAINESRFTYSHQSSYLPVHGLEGLMKDEKVIMRFRYLHGKQVTFHKGHNYLYRPLEMENMGLYFFCEQTEFIKISKAKKENTEYFEYTEKHLFHASEGVVYRTIEAVPTFPWNWLGSTKSFLTSLLHPTDENASDHKGKQDYAFRFMILFLPFRSREDFETDGCYQNAFQRACKEGRITDEMIEIAENIQTIHNSLASNIPPNTLSAETSEVDTGDFENAIEENEDESNDDLLASIGDLFVTLGNNNGLTEDTKTLDIRFGNRETEETTISKTILEPAFVERNTEDNSANPEVVLYPEKRFCSPYQNLNTLAMQTTLTRSEEDENPNKPISEIVNANGTWQSIAKWGKNNGLDDEQQTGFEILAAMYVLSFYDEAIVEGITDESYEEFIERKNGLCKLAQRNVESDEPLCMFITGPAGAGKCKSESK